MSWFISLFPQRPRGTVYRIVKRMHFGILEFKMRQCPDIRIERQETGRKKKKTFTRNVRRSKVGEEFYINYCSGWN